MKKFFAVFLSVLLFFSVVSGFSFHSEGNLSLDNSIKDDVYVVGGNISVTEKIEGDLLILGGNVKINSEVEEDIMCVGGSVMIEGEVGDDVRVMGGEVHIKENIGGDLLIVGGSVEVGDNTQISGDMAVSAGSVVFDGEVDGKLKGELGKAQFNGVVDEDAELKISDQKNFSVGEDSEIKGDLNYSAVSKVRQLEDIVGGEVKYSSSGVKDKDSLPVLGSFSLEEVFYNIVFLTVFGFLFVMIAKRFFYSVGENLSVKTAKSFLVGFLFYAVMPFVILFLLLSVIGVIFSVLFMVIYIFMFFFVNLINVVGYSSLVIYRMGGYDNLIWRKILLLVIGFSVLAAFIPFVDIIAAFGAMGAIIMKKYEILKEQM